MAVVNTIIRIFSNVPMLAEMFRYFFCASIQLFSSYFSSSSKIEFNRQFRIYSGCSTSIFTDTKSLTNDYHYINAGFDRPQSILEYTLWKVKFSIGTEIYMLPSNLILSIGKTAGCNNKVLTSNINIKSGSNRTTNLNCLCLLQKHILLLKCIWWSAKMASQ